MDLINVKREVFTVDIMPQACANCGKGVESPSGEKMRCAKCKTLYCGSTCQIRHWEAGHSSECASIAARGVERWYAEKASNDAVDGVATVDDKACYICGEEGCVSRGCECFGGGGFAHLSCLTKVAHETLVSSSSHARWERCALCEAEFSGPVKLALGRKAWATYGFPEAQTLMAGWRQLVGVVVLARALEACSTLNDRKDLVREALRLREAEVAYKARYHPDEEVELLEAKVARANCMIVSGHNTDALLADTRANYDQLCALHGRSHVLSLHAASPSARVPPESSRARERV